MNSTPSKNATNGTEPTLSKREQDVVIKAWGCIKSVNTNGEPQLDFDKLANIAGYANTNTARAVWGPIKKKLVAGAGAESSPTQASSANKGSASTAGRKRKQSQVKTPLTSALAEDDDGDMGTVYTAFPAIVKGGGGGDDNAVGDPATPTPKAKKPRTKAPGSSVKKQPKKKADKSGEAVKDNDGLDGAEGLDAIQQHLQQQYQVDTGFGGGNDYSGESLTKRDEF
ncbi:hypothetical protein F5Y19DRAFT_470277 [Xylariaceae sp. FL1651]|nr:hypothetical protein F5Y19DRAFT_470277 [Xylariaceae sp. FL1651]